MWGGLEDLPALHVPHGDDVVIAVGLIRHALSDENDPIILGRDPVVMVGPLERKLQAAAVDRIDDGVLGRDRYRRRDDQERETPCERDSDHGSTSTGRRSQPPWCPVYGLHNLPV